MEESLIQQNEALFTVLVKRLGAMPVKAEVNPHIRTLSGHKVTVVCVEFNLNGGSVLYYQHGDEFRLLRVKILATQPRDLPGLKFNGKMDLSFQWKISAPNLGEVFTLMEAQILKALETYPSEEDSREGKSYIKNLFFEGS